MVRNKTQKDMTKSWSFWMEVYILQSLRHYQQFTWNRECEPHSLCETRYWSGTPPEAIKAVRPWLLIAYFVRVLLVYANTREVRGSRPNLPTFQPGLGPSCLLSMMTESDIPHSL